MADSYTNVGQIQQVNGENSGTWGDITDTNWDINTKLIAGFLSQAITTLDVTLPNTDGVADDGKNYMIKTTGILTGNRNLIVPTKTRSYIIWNTNTGAFTMTVKTSGGTGVAVPQGALWLVICDGTNVVQVTDPSLVLSTISNLYTAQQNFGTATLSDGASIAWNLSSQQVAKVTLGGNRTLANPSNMVDGGTYILRVSQDGTGSRTLAYGAAYKWPLGSVPVLSTTINALDILTFTSDGTSMYGAIQKGFA